MNSLLKSVVAFGAVLACAWSHAETTSYWDPVLRAEKSADCTVLTAGTQTMNGGWYVVRGEVSCVNLSVSGTVNLILADGAKLTAVGEYKHAGIAVLQSDALTIWGQSGGTGELKAVGGEWAAGIGGNERGFGCDGGTVTVNGGTVRATGGRCAAGIGGGNQGSCGRVTVNGGRVFATAGENYYEYGGAGIGSGSTGASGGAVAITGGTVIAVSAVPGCDGIGNGTRRYSTLGTVEIAGGTVSASSFATPPTSAGTAVHRVKVSGLAPGAAVVLSGLRGYGCEGLYADEDGCVSLWLADGAYAFQAVDSRGNGGCYTVNVGGGDVEPERRGAVMGVTVNGWDIGYGAYDGCGWHRTDDGYVELEGGDYVLSGANDADRVMFAVAGDSNVTLSNLFLKGTSRDECCLWATNDVLVTLFLAGTNTLDATSDGEGLCIENSARMVITNAPGFADGDAVLRAYGGKGRAGIAVAVKGGQGRSAFLIAGGTVEAHGGAGAAGIGGSYYNNWDAGTGYTSDIYISGGRVRAYGGGTLSTSGKSGGGAGIGSAANNCWAATQVTVSGGFVEAWGGPLSAGIGGGCDSLGGDVRVSGGTVFASRGEDDSAPGQRATDMKCGWHRNGEGVLQFTGGSIRFSHLATESPRPAPVGGASGDSAVWCVTVKGLEPGAAVSLSGLDGYGRDGLYADADGKVYLWLPDGTHEFSVGGAPFVVIVNGANAEAVPGRLTGVTVNGVDTAWGRGEGWRRTDDGYIEFDGAVDYVLSGSNDADRVMFAVADDSNVTLSNLFLKGTAPDECCIWATNDVLVTLFLAGTNTLDATSDGEGLCIENSARMVITNAPGFADGDAVLRAYGGKGRAGIAVAVKGGQGRSAFLIAGGTVEAHGGAGAAGIGGSYYNNWDAGTGYTSDIYISGGRVMAYGGGTLSTSGKSGGGAGIGSAVNNYRASTQVTVTGGFVEAWGGPLSAGIGGGCDSFGGDVRISGGTVFACRGEDNSESGKRATDMKCGWHGNGEGVLQFAGGSVRLAHLATESPRPAPVGGASGDSAVWCVTVPDIPGEVLGVSGVGGYGLKDLSAADGCLYLWLPNGTYPEIDVTTAEGTLRYVATVADAHVTASRGVRVRGVEIDGRDIGLGPVEGCGWSMRDAHTVEFAGAGPYVISGANASGDRISFAMGNGTALVLSNLTLSCGSDAALTVIDGAANIAISGASRVVGRLSGSLAVMDADGNAELELQGGGSPDCRLKVSCGRVLLGETQLGGLEIGGGTVSKRRLADEPVVVTGGSFMLALPDAATPAPSNGAERVWCVTMSVAPGRQVSFGDGFPEGYGCRDVFADSSGRVCLWLPNGTYHYLADCGDGPVPYSASVSGASTVATVDWSVFTGVSVNGRDVGLSPVAGCGWTTRDVGSGRVVTLTGSGPYVLSGTNDMASPVSFEASADVNLSVSNLVLSCGEGPVLSVAEGRRATVALDGEAAINGAISGSVAVATAVRNAVLSLNGGVSPDCALAVAGGRVALGETRVGRLAVSGGTVTKERLAGDMTQVTGGSLALDDAENPVPAPSNGTDRVWCVTVTNLPPFAAVALTGLDGYERNDIVADARGRVCLWLPNGAYGFAIDCGYGAAPYAAEVSDANVFAWIDEARLSGLMVNGRHLVLGPERDCGWTFSEGTLRLVGEGAAYCLTNTLDGSWNGCIEVGAAATVVLEALYVQTDLNAFRIASGVSAVLQLRGRSQLESTSFGKAAVCVNWGSALTITNAPGAADAELKAFANNQDGAPLGSDKGVNCGDITIAGGRIYAWSSHGASRASGIGGGAQSQGNSGVIRITGGYVEATGGAYGGSGIGSGRRFVSVGDNTPPIVISGGTVIATGRLYHKSGGWGADIGRGLNAWAGSVTITGGSVLPSRMNVNPAPLDADGSRVWCVTVTNAPAAAEGTPLVLGGLGDYGVNDLQAINGNLYLWLPARDSDYVFTVTAVNGGEPETFFYRAAVAGANVTAERIPAPTREVRIVLPDPLPEGYAACRVTTNGVSEVVGSNGVYVVRKGSEVEVSALARDGWEFAGGAYVLSVTNFTALADVELTADDLPVAAIAPRDVKVELRDGTLTVFYDNLRHDWSFDPLAVTSVVTDVSLAGCRLPDTAEWFAGFTNVTNVDLTYLDTSAVTNMTAMFSNCVSLVSVTVGDGFTAGAVVASDSMFTNCVALLGGAGTAYDASHVDASRAVVDMGEVRPGYLRGPLPVAGVVNAEGTATEFFHTVTGALAAVTNGCTLRLFANVAGVLGVTSDFDLTLDDNGFSVNAELTVRRGCTTLTRGFATNLITLNGADETDDGLACIRFSGPPPEGDVYLSVVNPSWRTGRPVIRNAQVVSAANVRICQPGYAAFARGGDIVLDTTWSAPFVAVTIDTAAGVTNFAPCETFGQALAISDTVGLLDYVNDALYFETNVVTAGISVPANRSVRLGSVLRRSEDGTNTVWGVETNSPARLVGSADVFGTLTLADVTIDGPLTLHDGARLVLDAAFALTNAHLYVTIADADAMKDKVLVTSPHWTPDELKRSCRVTNPGWSFMPVAGEGLRLVSVSEFAAFLGERFYATVDEALAAATAGSRVALISTTNADTHAHSDTVSPTSRVLRVATPGTVSVTSARRVTAGAEASWESPVSRLTVLDLDGVEVQLAEGSELALEDVQLAGTLTPSGEGLLVVTNYAGTGRISVRIADAGTMSARRRIAVGAVGQFALEGSLGELVQEGAYVCWQVDVFAYSYYQKGNGTVYVTVNDGGKVKELKPIESKVGTCIYQYVRDNGGTKDLLLHLIYLDYEKGILRVPTDVVTQYLSMDGSYKGVTDGAELLAVDWAVGQDGTLSFRFGDENRKIAGISSRPMSAKDFTNIIVAISEDEKNREKDDDGNPSVAAGIGALIGGGVAGGILAAIGALAGGGAGGALPGAIGIAGIGGMVGAPVAVVQQVEGMIPEDPPGGEEVQPEPPHADPPSKFEKAWEEFHKWASRFFDVATVAQAVKDIVAMAACPLEYKGFPYLATQFQSVHRKAQNEGGNYPIHWFFSKTIHQSTLGSGTVDIEADTSLAEFFLKEAQAGGLAKGAPFEHFMDAFNWMMRVDSLWTLINEWPADKRAAFEAKFGISLALVGEAVSLIRNIVDQCRKRGFFDPPVNCSVTVPAGANYAVSGMEFGSNGITPAKPRTAPVIDVGSGATLLLADSSIRGYTYNCPSGLIHVRSGATLTLNGVKVSGNVSVGGFAPIVIDEGAVVWLVGDTSVDDLAAVKGDVRIGQGPCHGKPDPLAGNLSGRVNISGDTRLGARIGTADLEESSGWENIHSLLRDRWYMPVVRNRAVYWDYRPGARELLVPRFAQPGFSIEMMEVGNRRYAHLSGVLTNAVRGFHYTPVGATALVDQFHPVGKSVDPPADGVQLFSADIPVDGIPTGFFNVRLMEEPVGNGGSDL